MADFASSTSASAVHPLSGSSRPGAAPRYSPKQAPRPCPQVRPRLDGRTPEYIMRLVPLIRREDNVTLRFSMLYQHQLLSEHATYLEKLGQRLTRRVTRWTRRMMADKATDNRELGLKADVAIELISAGWSDGGVGDEMMRSVCHDAIALGLDAACLPQIPGGNFGAYHRAVLETHRAMEALPPEATDADAVVFMDRWADIDRMAMADRPKTFADAIGALHYARREHHQFNIETRDGTDSEPCPGDRLILHLLDGAITVLQRVVQEDAAREELARPGHTCTLDEAAEIDFEPVDFGTFVPDSNEEWGRTGNPYPITSRVAFLMLRKTKAEMVEMLGKMLDEQGDKFVENQAQRFDEAKEFFGFYADMAEKAHLRYLVAASALFMQRDGKSEEELAPEAAPAAAEVAPDRRAVAAYKEWLHMETRLLGMEMYPEMGADSERFTPVGTAAHHYHFPSGAMATWRDLPQPTSRAEAMCRVLGIDWTTDGQRDERFMPIAPAGDATRAA